MTTTRSRVLMSLLVAITLEHSSRALLAGDAVGIAYDADGKHVIGGHVWHSSTKPGGGDYKTSVEASEEVLRILKQRGFTNVSVVHHSDVTGYFSVASAYTEHRTRLVHVESGTTQAEADRKVLAGLAKIGGVQNQQVDGRYFSYGEDANAPLPAND